MFFILYELIMLIYAKYLIFNLNRLLKLQYFLFFVNIFFWTPFTIVHQKISVSKLISYVFHCFMNFLCISLFFRTFVFYCFFTEICCSYFFKHYLAKINAIQSLKGKIITILWITSKIPICIGFVHKILKLSDFRADVHVLKVT